jgi:lipopolysaccharide biosynthesis regulator YciM
MADRHKHHESSVLVEKLGQAYQGIKQGPSRGTLLFVGLAVLVVVLVLTWRYFSNSSRATNSERWVKLDDAVFAEQLEKLMQDKELQNTPQGRQARIKDARRLLDLGLGGLARGDPAALGNVEKATQLYEDLLKDSSLLPLQRQEALLNAAKGNVTLGNLDRARELYNQLKDDKEAKQALQRLDDPASLEELKKVIERARQAAAGKAP